MAPQSHTYPALFLTFADTNPDREIPRIVDELAKLNWDPHHRTIRNYTSKNAQTYLHSIIKGFVGALGNYQNPEDKLIIYFGGHAIEDEESGMWRWHGASDSGVCAEHLVKVDPEPMLKYLAEEISNDILFIFQCPFSLTKTKLQKYFEKAPKSNRQRNVQAIIINEELSKTVKGPLCNKLGCSDRAISVNGMGKVADAKTPFMFDYLIPGLQFAEYTVWDWVNEIRKAWPEDLGTRPNLVEVLGSAKDFELRSLKGRKPLRGAGVGQTIWLNEE